ncbi:hypothetical protein BAUCODRAFT_274926 [Baudoinia panamericana UAMH 10762]|uniref:Uncharacterized protein n=1 Tax=Baudoinia panamericana (strain UAMH 10762) TaxID=717646 RepID=M2MZF8_BAUPA|nr:uncharacterized protein BAUCODRAFT_274926 [Baudoinia panamericana UAMH 10762]EMC92054.1 hypothetical protein BAUCODRAFT_274926 [Baudoinia panamericana UAMH 10762]
MDPETLIAFHFTTPAHIRSVELLGSWDNFARAYPMRHDRRRGPGFWSGCFKFTSIVFDGLESSFNAKPRSGGLKQGGTYWYYYRLDYDVETYDDGLECTAGCPLMPGQMMNVLEVPVEVVQPPSRCRSAGHDGLAAALLGGLRGGQRQTLDPSDKFVMLEPPPVSKVHMRCISDLALGGRLEKQAGSKTNSVGRSAQSPHDGDELQTRPGKRRRAVGRSSRHNTASRRSQISALSHTSSSFLDVYAEKWEMPTSRPVSRGSVLVSPITAEVEVEAVPPPPPTRLPPLPPPALLPPPPPPPLDTPLPSPVFRSPTFSAETISSNGAYTPFRLSGGEYAPQYYHSSSYFDTDPAKQVEHVTLRLQDLELRKSPVSLVLPPPSPLSDSHRTNEGEATKSSAPRTRLETYSLPSFAPPSDIPHVVNSESMLLTPALALSLETEASRGSMVDDIFAELGYLGSSIS